MIGSFIQAGCKKPRVVAYSACTGLFGLPPYCLILSKNHSPCNSGAF
ncbi:MAG: hypothetical protein IJT73_03660 [Selenomonadaceae bacterium]|nr:hypothetical protein [Selenomonadaceae bacterium]